MSKNNYNFESFIEKHKNTKSSFGNKIIIEKSEVKKHFRGFLIDPGLKKIIKTEFEKILFGFKNSFVVFEDGVVPSLPGTNGKKYSFKEVRDFTVKKTGFITSGHWFDKNSNKVSLIVGGDFKKGTELFEEFQKLLSDKKTSPVPKKSISKTDSDEKTSKDKSKVVKDNETSKKSKTPKSLLDGVTIIVKPKGKLSFGDLNGNTVPGIKTTLKQRCRDEGSYLGFKTTSKSSRWILINKEDVNPFLDDPEFVNKYSNYKEIKKKIPKIIDIENLNKENKIKKEESKIEFERQVNELIKSKKIDINQSIILQSVLELEEKYKPSSNYLTESEVLNTEFRNNSRVFRLKQDESYKGYWKSWSKDKKILFGFKSGIIFTKTGIHVLEGLKTRFGFDTYGILSFEYSFYSSSLNGNGVKLNHFQHLDPQKNKKFYIDSLHYDLDYEYFRNYSGYDFSLKSLFSNLKTLNLKRINYLSEDYKTTEENNFELENDEIKFFKELLELVKVKRTILNKIIKEKESNRKKELSTSIKKSLSEFDKDDNGELDTVQIKDDFDNLVKKHQKKIIEIDRNYIQQFVKISNYQKLKRENLQTIFSSISNSKFQENLDETIELLKERIHSYELILFHSLCMVTCLVEDDMFTFYEIHESFDKLKIFKSDHEREVSEKLTNIEIGIYDLMSSIRSMERSVIREIGHLSYVTQSSFHNLSESVTKQLSSINSSIKFNNLLTGIQTYQTYKINQNTKSLRG